MTDESHWPAILAEKPENWFTKKAQVEKEAERKRLADLKAAEEERLAKEADLKAAEDEIKRKKQAE